MDGISARNAPSIQGILVDEGVSALEVGWVLQESVVLVLDVCPRNLLLDNLLSPIVIEPRLGGLFGGGVREQKGVLQPCHIQVDLDMWYCR